MMSIRRKLMELYWNMERRITPGLKYSQHWYEQHLLEWIPEGVTWLDVGCGRRLLPEWRVEAERKLSARAKTLVGIDLDLGSLKDNVTADVHVFGPVSALPFRDSFFDVVTANMVVEHLDNPAASFTEIARVLKPGGLFLFHTPNAKAFPTALARIVAEPLKAPMARLLENRRAKDVFRTYYRCNSAEDIGRCAHEAGLVPVDVSFVSTSAVFAVVPPLAFIELLWLRAVQAESRRHLRSNVIAVLRKV